MQRSWQVLLLAPVLAWGWGDETAKQNRAAIATLQQRIQAQQERIDGLVSVIEGLNETIGRLQRDVRKNDDTSEKIVLTRIEALERRVAKLETALAQRNGAKNAQSVSRSASSKASSVSHTSTPKLSASKRYSSAVRAYKKRAYDTAKALFAQLASEGFKPAASNFYLGEIAYYTKQYKDAIYYYKKSADLYDKAGYMDVLMLHTAVSLEKTGQKEQAKAFYQALIERYGSRKSARIAKKRLVRLH